MTTTAIQGVAGSFHQDAATLLAPDSQLIHCDTFPEVFQAVLQDRADYGVVAVENSLNGSINIVYRLLARHGLWVSGECFLRIEQFLIGSQSASLSALNNPQTLITSHPVALAQCELWLDEHLPLAQRQEGHDTAASVEALSPNQPHHLAIAGDKAAALYNKTILAGPINDDIHNYTRFFLLSKPKPTLPAANKTSIILETGHAPGALQNALQLFAAANINLSKLDSHPIAGDKWHYAFYLDFEAGLEAAVTQQILADLKAQDCTVTILGSYEAADLPLNS